MNKICEQLISRGYCFVPFKHHPKKIKDAIKKSRFRPMAKHCFSNAQKLVSRQLNSNLFYAEGIVSGLIPFEHAWIMDENDVHYDITLDPMPKIHCYKKYDFKDVLNNMKKTMLYTPIDPVWLNTMQMAVLMGYPLDLDVDQLKCKIKESFDVLKKINSSV